MLNSTPFFYLFGSNGVGTNPVTWSISSEMISYLIFGYVMLLKKFKDVMMIVLILTSIIFRYYYFNLPPTVLNLEFFRGIISFFIGVLIFKTRRVKINSIFEYISVGLLLIQMYSMKYNLLDERFLEIVLLNIIFGLMIFVFVNSDGGITRVLNSNILQYLGKISYSIYLNHLIVITVFHRIIFQILNISNNQINQILVFIFSIIITVIYSNLTYKFFEKKMSSKLRAYLIK
jgi:peptidoglycan/LPS O-acetylase OafA/YrhL